MLKVEVIRQCQRSRSKVEVTCGPNPTHPTIIRSYGEGLLAFRPNPKLKDNPLSGVRDFSFNIFAVTLYSWRPSLHPLPENALFCGDWEPLIMVGIRTRGGNSWLLLRSWDSVVGAVIKLTGWTIRGSNHGRENIFFLSNILDRLWDPLKIQITEYWGCVPRVNHSECDTDRSPPSTPEVKNE
jgi:hypothetical protein